MFTSFLLHQIYWQKSFFILQTSEQANESNNLDLGVVHVKWILKHAPRLKDEDTKTPSNKKYDGLRLKIRSESL